MSELLPCPFCGSKNIDAKGWASTDRSGPACDDCGGSADTVELWNSRPAQGTPSPAQVEAGAIAILAELTNGTQLHGAVWADQPETVKEHWLRCSRVCLISALPSTECG